MRLDQMISKGPSDGLQLRRARLQLGVGGVGAEYERMLKMVKGVRPWRKQYGDTVRRLTANAGETNPLPLRVERPGPVVLCGEDCDKRWSNFTEAYNDPEFWWPFVALLYREVARVDNARAELESPSLPKGSGARGRASRLPPAPAP